MGDHFCRLRPCRKENSGGDTMTLESNRQRQSGSRLYQIETRLSRLEAALSQLDEDGQTVLLQPSDRSQNRETDDTCEHLSPISDQVAIDNSLVGAVAVALKDSSAPFSFDWKPEARAAIAAVVDWLDNNDDAIPNDVFYKKSDGFRSGYLFATHALDSKINP